MFMDTDSGSSFENLLSSGKSVHLYYFLSVLFIIWQWANNKV